MMMFVVSIYERKKVEKIVARGKDTEECFRKIESILIEGGKING
jgi:hypothetical protein